MSRNTLEFQPGAILHEVIVGAFRARGMTFEAWCRDNGITPTNARQATFGQSRGASGKLMREALIEAAGREFVQDAYVRRVSEHYRQVTGGAA